MKTRKTKTGKGITRRAIAFLLCMTMMLGLGMQEFTQVNAEGMISADLQEGASTDDGTNTTTPANQSSDTTGTTVTTGTEGQSSDPALMSADGVQTPGDTGGTGGTGTDTTPAAESGTTSGEGTTDPATTTGGAATAPAEGSGNQTTTTGGATDTTDTTGTTGDATVTTAPAAGTQTPGTTATDSATTDTTVPADTTDVNALDTDTDLLTDVEDNTEETEETESQPYEASYEDDEIVISVSAEAGVLPEEAELSVTPIVQTEITDDMSEEAKAEAEAVNEQYALTEQKLTEESEENEVVMEGFLAYDISFLLDGEEIEPNGNVNVIMDFHEAAIPEGVSEGAEVAVKHLKKDETAEDGVVVEDVTEKASVETTEQLEVQKVELTAESFSTYTVTWYRDDDDKYPVRITSHYGYLDSDGNFVEFPDNTYTGSRLPKDWQDIHNNKYIGGDVVLSNYAGNVTYDQNTYIFDIGYVTRGQGAKFSNENPATRVSLNRDESGDYYFYRDYNDGWPKVGNRLSQNKTNFFDIYFVYSKVANLTTVGTLDNNDHGIKMTMTDLEESNQTGLLEKGGPTASHNGVSYYNVEQGILNPVLSNGYPTLSGYAWPDDVNRTQGASLKSLFSTDNTRTVNHLFLTSTYNSTGYYEYSSFENYAYLGTETDFTVYEQLGTPKENDSQFFYNRGNFLPYNPIRGDRLSVNRNLYDEDGVALKESDARYNEELFYAGADGAINYHFAMTLEANFYQPKDGIAEYNGVRSDMIYEFNGDDDLWVFIDDVLVLDIGGIHDAHSGYINFRTGEVYVELGYDNNGEKITPYRSTIKALYAQAGKFPDGTNWDADKVEQYFDGDTFVDFSKHTMKMFYMERGAGASNLHIKFNLQTVPDGTIEVAKELSNTDKELYANEEFKFELYVQEKAEGWTGENPVYKENKYVQVTSENLSTLELTATLKKSGVVSEGPLIWSADGNTFLLKPDQSVVFSGLKANQMYYVKEVGVESERYDEVIINNATVASKDENGDVIKTESVEINDNVISVSSGEGTVGSRPIVAFTNDCSAANSNELRITKEMATGQATSDTFTFQIQLEGVDGELVNYVGPYYLTDGDGNYYYYDENNALVFNGTESIVCGYTDADGQVSGVPAGYTVAITQILSGTDFKVTEIDLNTDIYRTPEYEVEAGTADETNVEPGVSASGTIALNKDAEVTVTNSYISDSTIPEVEDVPLNKQIDYLGDSGDNPDTGLTGSEYYRLYLDATGVPIQIPDSADVLLILDRSGSMKYSYEYKEADESIPTYERGHSVISAAKNAVDTLLEGETDNRVGVLWFDRNVYDNYVLDFTDNPDSLKTFISVSDNGGWGSGTNYETAFEKAIEMISEDTSNRNKYIIFVTDGEPQGYLNSNGEYINPGFTDTVKKRVLTAAQEFKKIDLSGFYGVFVSTDKGENFLKEVVNNIPMTNTALRGTFAASDEKSLQDAFQQILGSITQQVSNVTITDTLSQYVEFVNETGDTLAEQDIKGEIDEYRIALKVTKTTTENGITNVTELSAENGDYTYTIDKDTKTVTVNFGEDYFLEPGAKYTISFNVKLTNQAFTDTMDDNGDANTDYPGNYTSSGNNGHFSNDKAQLTYEKPDGTGVEKDYPKPVVQVPDKAEWQLIKVSASNDSVKLSGAVFELVAADGTKYTGTSQEDDSLTGTDEQGYILWTDASGKEIDETDIPAGTYTLTEITAPAGYVLSTYTWQVIVKNTEAPVIRPILANETLGKEIAVQKIGTDEEPCYQLKIENTVLYELPQSGGPGIYLYMLGGTLLMMAGTLLVYKKRKEEVLRS